MVLNNVLKMRGLGPEDDALEKPLSLPFPDPTLIQLRYLETEQARAMTPTV